MARRPTIKDLANAANVSIATVDRVLNKRSTVRDATAERVLLAAETIGYHASGLLKQRYAESRPKKRVSFLLQRSSDAFYQALRDALVKASNQVQNFHLEANVTFMDEISSQFIAERIKEHGESSDALVIVALDHHAINKELEQLSAAGKPVITLLSTVSTQNRTGHIGLDSFKVGRTAAWAISRLSPTENGTIGILLGSKRYRGQEISEISFISYFRDLDENYKILPPMLDLDDDRLAAEATSELLADNDDLVGIYSVGGGVAGIVETLRNEGLQRNIVTVCNEITPVTRNALRDGIIDMVIATPVDRLATEVYQLLEHAFTTKGEPGLRTIHLPAEIYVAENI